MKIGRSIRHYTYGLILLDSFGWIISFIFAYWARNPALFPHVSPEYIVILPFVVPMLLLSFYYFRLYHSRFGLVMEAIQIGKATVLGMLVFFAFLFFYRGFSFSRLFSITYVVLSFITVLFIRGLYHRAFSRIMRSIRWQWKILVAGGGPIGRQIIDEIIEKPTEYRIIGFLDDDEDVCGENYKGVRCLGKTTELERILLYEKVDEVIIAMPSAPRGVYSRLIEICNHLEVKFRFIPKMYEIMLQDVTVDVLGALPLIGLRGSNLTGYNYLFKRAVDITLASLLLAIFALPMLIIAGLIKIVSPGPVLFKQERIGLNRQPFTFFKFRSMHLNCDDAVHKAYVQKWIGDCKASAIEDNGVTVHKLTDDPRVIPYIGHFIRKYSIDELPQLFNVILGDMSLIGPRPCLRYEMQQYKSWHKARFEALPGITGLWQISGRNRLSFDEMVKLDIHYLQNWSLEKDLFILFKTPFTVLWDRAY
jgi:exopolysaccharide biosynthesis polyprenyl glycosylphosphotransferase